MIDTRAVVSANASIHETAEIGPYTVIGDGVEIGAETWVGPHVVIQGPTKIGSRNKIYQFSSVGADPQDKKYHGEPTKLIIGDDNLIRESCTINRGTEQGGGETTIGDGNWVMAYVHVAHDCHIGSHTVLANNASLAGHVDVGDYAILGGFTLVHQFCAVGQYSFCAMGSVIPKDVPPFLMVSGHMANAHGLNTVGLNRHGFSADTIRSLKQAYRVIFRSGLTIGQAIQAVNDSVEVTPEVESLIQFVSSSSRGVVR